MTDSLQQIFLVHQKAVSALDFGDFPERIQTLNFTLSVVVGFKVFKFCFCDSPLASRIGVHARMQSG